MQPNTESQSISQDSTGASKTFFNLDRWTILIGILFCLVYNHYIAFTSEIEIDLEIDTYEVSYLRVYWADHGQAFSEQNSRKVVLRKGRGKYRFLIGSLEGIDRIRIDPMEMRWRDDPDEQISLHRVGLNQRGYENLEYQGESALRQLQPTHGLSDVEVRDGVLVMRTANNDSQLLLSLSPVKTSLFPPIFLLNYFLIFLIVGLVRPCIIALKDNLAFVPVFLFATLPLVIAMAALSNFNTHPDEFVHLHAVDYFSTHWIPPPMDSAEIEHTFSDYGQTRLASLEIYYQVAGVFTRLLEPLNLDFFYDARIFGVFLFLVLFYLSACHTGFRYVALPLLISPQIWYLFSYINSDGFALFVSTILMYQAVSPTSKLNQLLVDTKVSRLTLSIVVLGLLMGSILLLKSNFYILGLFLFLYLIWRWCCGDFQDRKLLMTRMALLLLVAIGLFGARWGLDRAVNGFDRAETFNQLRAEYAQPQFNPETPLEDTHIYLHLRAKGTSLDVVTDYLGWGAIQFGTSFGSYGYTQYNASDIFYSMVGNLCMLLVLSVIILVLIYGSNLIIIYWQ